MDRTELPRAARTLRFEELYRAWLRGEMTQGWAAGVLGVSERTFRRYASRYEAGGPEGLRDGRVAGGSHRRAPAAEVAALEALYGQEYEGWSVRHFHERYVEDHGGRRSYTWVKNRLQGAGLVKRGRRRGRHRLRRPRKPLEGLMVHQDGSTHEWVPGRVWDLIVTSDDATGRVYSGFCVAEEGTWSSFRGVRETVEAKGLFASLYTDRGSHYWHTPKAGEKVDRSRPTQFGRAMGELGIEMIPSYSPQARGRCERLFRTLQGRLPNELAREGIADMGEANEYLGAYWPRFNAAFGVEAAGEGTAFVPLSDVRLDDILCLREARTVGNDNCVSYRGKRLQIAPQPHRYPLRAGEGPGTRVRGREHVGVPRQAPAGPLRPAGMSAGDLERGGRDGVTRDTAPAPARYARLCGGRVQTGHVTCYQTGQLHLLPTHGSVVPLTRRLTERRFTRACSQETRSDGSAGTDPA
ncbi:ISNCY family transposase [Candidatus Palauibacter sp.]|uniref:ISNCY family transposase n=1 Tax=Candidatus Palauibacter sp. TaxID=3101350 RepID=UPI003CC65A22